MLCKCLTLKCNTVLQISFLRVQIAYRIFLKSYIVYIPLKKALNPLVHPDSAILILGTMPGEQSLLHQQYYANKGNHFWKLLYAVLGETFSTDYAERKKLLFDNRIALWDVLSHCEREGSLDSRIKNEIANDFDTFYTSHPSIRAVFFSSKAAEKYYERHAGKKNGIYYHTLPSPSGANASMSFIQKLEKWQIIKTFLTP
jgi:hypoxanthine-DNA glycosylase